MKVGLVYFSQTGNTRKIANSICNGIIEAGAQCDLIRFEDVSVKALDSYDLIGIGCPVFYYREPLHIRKWLQSLPDSKRQHWFVFCTHGNVIGNFFPSMAELLRKTNARIIGYHHSYAGIQVPHLPSPGYTKGHPDAIDLAEAETFGSQMVRQSTESSNNDRKTIPAPGPVSSPEWIAEAARFSPEFLKKVMPKLKWNEQICSNCGTCEEECPVGGIDLSETPPRIQNPCIYCWNCVNRCPELALNADWDRLIASAPEYLFRCRKELDLEVDKGRFRWLIDPDNVDPRDVFMYKRIRQIESS